MYMGSRVVYRSKNGLVYHLDLDTARNDRNGYTTQYIPLYEKHNLHEGGTPYNRKVRERKRKLVDTPNVALLDKARVMLLKKAGLPTE